MQGWEHRAWGGGKACARTAAVSEHQPPSCCHSLQQLIGDGVTLMLIMLPEDPLQDVIPNWPARMGLRSQGKRQSGCLSPVSEFIYWFKIN